MYVLIPEYLSEINFVGSVEREGVRKGKELAVITTKGGVRLGWHDEPSCQKVEDLSQIIRDGMWFVEYSISFV